MSKMPDKEEKKYKEVTTGVEFETDWKRNGKAVYGKEIDCGFINSGDTTIQHNISSIDEIIGFKGRFSHVTSGTTYNIPRSYPLDPATYNVDAQALKDKIIINAGTNFNGSTFRACITVFYTKS